MRGIEFEEAYGIALRALAAKEGKRPRLPEMNVSGAALPTSGAISVRRRQAIWSLCDQGHRTKAIAAMLGENYQTVDYHVRAWRAEHRTYRKGGMHQ